MKSARWNILIAFAFILTGIAVPAAWAITVTRTRYGGEQFDESGNLKTNNAPAKWVYQYVDQPVQLGRYSFETGAAEPTILPHYVQPVRMMQVTGKYPFFATSHSCAFESIRGGTNVTSGAIIQNAEPHYCGGDRNNRNYYDWSYVSVGNWPYMVDVVSAVIHFRDDADLGSLSQGSVYRPFIKYIGTNCYAGQGLMNAVVPEGVTHIEMGAFSDNKKLETVTLPSTLVSIGPKAFAGCSALKTINIPDGMQEIAGDAFTGCTNCTVKLQWPSQRPYMTGAFAPFKAFAVVVAEGVKNIADSDFKGNTKLTAIALPTTLTNLAANAFNGCVNLTTVNTSVGLPNVPAGVFRDCQKLKSICIGGKTTTVPNGVTYIGASAFNGCTSLVSVDMSTGATPALQTIRVVSDNAFANCQSLTAFAMPSSATFIGKTAFSNCTGLTSITITGNVTGLGHGAFNNCSSLSKVTIWGNITNSYALEERPFAGCDNLANVTFGAQASKVPSYCFYSSSALTNVSLEDSVRNIEVYAFMGCVNLVTVNTSSGLPNVPAGVFRNCSKLRSIRLGGKSEAVPDGVTYIGASAFNGCTSLTSVDMSTGTTPASQTIRLISDNAFANCKSLTAFAMPSSATFIGKTAFSNCTGLASITITGNVTGLGHGAFNNCTSLAKVTIWGNITNSYYFDERPFAGCNKLANVTLSAQASKVPSYCFCNVTSLTNVTLGDSVRSIEAHAFNRCTGLGALAIPDSVTDIRGCAFMNCTKLKDMTIPRNVETVGINILSNCSSLVRLRVPETWLGTEKLANAGVPSTCTIVPYALGTVHTVTFGGNGGTSAVGTNTYTIGQTYGTLPAAMRDGYAFAGWWTDPTNGVQVTEVTTVPDISYRVLYAHWSPCVQTVAFDANGGECTTETGAYTVDTVYVNFPEATMEGWSFAGWWTKAEGGTQVVPGDRVSTDLERTLYAHWKPLATSTTPVAVPYEWIANVAADLLAAADGDYEAVAKTIAPIGRPLWECYLTGADLSVDGSDFTVSVEIADDGDWTVLWCPDLNDGQEHAVRRYTVEGKRDLLDDEWTDVTDEDDLATKGWLFFRVGVSLAE